MIIIIDAYNFLKAIVPHKSLTDIIIKSWIEQFHEYIKKRKNQIILVFDAGPFLNISKETHGLVQIVYAGQASSADHFIQEWISKNAKLDILLVTSDRQIRQYADSHGIVSLSSQEFYSIFKNVMQDLQDQEIFYDRSIVKTKKEAKNDEKLDALLEQASRHLLVDYEKNEYNENNIRMRSASKKSKHDRVILKKIEKI